MTSYILRWPAPYETARGIFADAAKVHPSNYRLTQAWGVMEMSAGGGGVHGLAVARPLFARSAEIAPWAVQAWVALHISPPPVSAAPLEHLRWG